MTKYIRHGIEITPPKTASGQIKRIYAQINADLMNVPEPFLVHSPAADILAGAWSVFRESLIAGQVNRGLKETVAVAVSDLNKCPWCLDSHTVSLHATGRSDVVQAVKNGSKNIQDPRASALLEWAKATRNPKAPILADPPFTPEEAPEFIGCALTFHYLNRVVNATLVKSPFPDQYWLRNPMQHAFGWLFRFRIRENPPSGETLGFLPEAGLPPVLRWAKASPSIASAFARFNAIIERAGEKSLPGPVRALVWDRIADWNGEDMGLSRLWVADAISELPDTMQPAARLALLAGLASHQIGQQDVDEFRHFNAGDQPLIEVLAWGSFTAARRIGTWLS
jgi:AhpD family alkylhydroperoxidase